MRNAPRPFMIGGMKNDTIAVAGPASSATWARAFAVLYDPFLWTGEQRGVRALRAELLAKARGLTVEIGSGTGLNLPHYPDAVDDLVLAEPDARMRSRLEKRVSHGRQRARVVDA